MKMKFEKLDWEREEERGECEHHQRKKHEAPFFYSLFLITNYSSTSFSFSFSSSSSSSFFLSVVVLSWFLDRIDLIRELHV